jgi:MFS family permease
MPLGAPSSVLLTLFLQEWLQAEKWQIGLVVTMNFLGTVLEPVGAYLDERLGCRRPLFLRTFLLARIPFLLFAILPFISSAHHAEPHPAPVAVAVRVRSLAMKDLRRQREVTVRRLRMISSAEAGATRGAHGRNLDDPLSRERAAACARPGAGGGSPRK